MVLFRSAVKQIARRHGYHATFMCRPKLPNVFASGWHLHQSLVSRASGENAFMAKDKGEALSAFGKHYLAGLLEHARASAVFTTPTINGYKRYRSYSLAPDRAIWGRDNRGVMIRVLGGAGDPATRLENRIGEPAANPYLYMASQILSGLDGVDRKLDPGPSADTPYETKAELLPKSLARGGARAAATIRSSAMRWARRSWTITSTSRMPRSSASRPKCRTGSTANISRCFEALARRTCASEPSSLRPEGSTLRDTSGRRTCTAQLASSRVAACIARSQREDALRALTGRSNPQIPVLQIRLGQQLLRGAAPHGAAALDHVVAVGDAWRGCRRSCR